MDCNPSLKVNDSRGVQPPVHLLDPASRLSSLDETGFFTQFLSDKLVRRDSRATPTWHFNGYAGEIDREGYYAVTVKKIAGEI